MKPLTLRKPKAIFVVLGLAACSNGQTAPGTQATPTGGAASGIDGGGDVAGMANAGAPSESGGVSSMSSTGGTSGSQGGESNLGGASSTFSSGGGTTSFGGTAPETGGNASSTGGASVSPGLPSQCSSKAKAGQTQPVSGLTLDMTTQFAAVTPDELTLVWTAPSATGVTVYIADRTVATATWDTPQSVADVPAAGGQVAVTPDGLTIAYVDSSSRRSFASMSRSSRSLVFQFNDPASGLEFIIQNSSSLLGPDENYAYPVYGPHLTSFYYAIESSAGGFTWYMAGRFEPQGVFTEGTAIAFTNLPESTAVLSGVAWDENTLFFVDPSTGQTRWSFYNEGTTKFGPFSDLGTLGFVQPSQSCSRLYGSASAGSITMTPLQ